MGWKCDLDVFVELTLKNKKISLNMTKLTNWHVCPVKTHFTLTSTQSTQSRCRQHEGNLDPLLPFMDTFKTHIGLGRSSG